MGCSNIRKVEEKFRNYYGALCDCLELNTQTPITFSQLIKQYNSYEKAEPLSSSLLLELTNTVPSLREELNSVQDLIRFTQECTRFSLFSVLEIRRCLGEGLDLTSRLAKQFIRELRFYLEGKSYDSTLLPITQGEFPELRYSGYAYRGMRLASMEELDLFDNRPVSWTKSLSIATDFSFKTTKFTNERLKLGLVARAYLDNAFDLETLCKCIETLTDDEDLLETLDQFLYEQEVLFSGDLVFAELVYARLNSVDCKELRGYTWYQLLQIGV